MENIGELADKSLPLQRVNHIDQLGDRFDHAIHDAIQNGRPWPSIEDYLGDAIDPVRSELRKELLAVEASYRRQQAEGGNPDPPSESSSETDLWQPGESESGQPAGDTTSKQPQPALEKRVGHPSRIGRFRIERVLGKGAFGTVYRGYDDELKRPVAIKVPHRHLVHKPEDIELYLEEAQVVASLDSHANIVRVHDVGRTEDGLCYVVSEFIQGSDLARKIREKPLSHRESAELVAAIAEALQHAHQHMVVHRDVKPANILIDAAGKPHLADFGLALKEEDFGEGSVRAGTPAYMSPEQARCESHLVDGRADIFSLGVVFYELLTASRPFWDTDREKVLERIKTLEPCPPRQLDNSIPKELERICLKALSKRASDRYTTALDMAEDLRHFLAPTAGMKPVDAAKVEKKVDSSKVTPLLDALDSGKSVKIVPKGLRSFDAQDADFFLELLPGPRDRDGLPESIRFWKYRIEETNSEETFRVGLIYGPSGSGKSSLVKAGLLPRLAEHVIPIYVEATTDDTEACLLRGLRKQCPDLQGNLGLKESVAALRRGRGIPAGNKVLIVLDHFEQWLHAKPSYENVELVEALRQCDGERMQCIVMVRDDFWLAVSRFLRDLEIRLVEGTNSVLADLFDLDHARKVLAAFGRAFGKLPESSSEKSKEQTEFLKQAVSGLAQEGKVVCVRLALFAEMMKGKPWTPATLKAVGGTEGVGVTFLEETFSAATAPPEHRYHQKAARDVLKALLPESGTDIKGQMRSYAELLEASRYSSRPRDFDDLIRILDSEIRLITPTEPEGKEEASPAKAGEKYYQLTHDYLVHSIREWLTRKQKETRRGRAELLLAERSALWNAKPENRHLPLLREFLNIRLLTARRNWTGPQRKMLGQAGRVHGIRSGIVATMLLVAIAVGMSVRHAVVEKQYATRAEGLVDGLVNADITKVPSIVIDLEKYRTWTDPLLKDKFDQAKEGSSQRLNMALALLPVDESKMNYLRDQLLVVTPNQFTIVRDALISHQDAIIQPLWNAALDSKRKTQQRFQAACALATYAPGDQRWKQIANLVAGRLVTLQSSDLVVWREALRPARRRLGEPLAAIYRNPSQDQQQRSFAAETLADYAADQPDVLANLVMDADEKQFAVLYARLSAHHEASLDLLQRELRKEIGYQDQKKKEEMAKRQANAAVALLRMNYPEKVWPLLKYSPDPRVKESCDPRVRSYIIHRFAVMGADAGAIIAQLANEKDVTILRALVLSLGEYNARTLPRGAGNSLVRQIQDIYQTASDPGLHGATGWLLYSWTFNGWLKGVDEELAKDGEKRERLLKDIRNQLRRRASSSEVPTPALPRWYVTDQAQTMVVIPGPVEFLMGSPTTEANREDGPGGKRETQHKKRIKRSFAIAAKEVTMGQFQRFYQDCFHTAFEYGKETAPTDDCPVNSVTWYQAASYCNWLSKQDGIPEGQWCYEKNSSGKDDEGMVFVPGRTGYRLPTEAEWEYACRAGALTSYYYGESEELLVKYAWYAENARDRGMLPGKPGRFGTLGLTLKPNDFGLFDMMGNASEWCQNKLEDYKPGDDFEDRETIENDHVRALRGGEFTYQAGSLRSAYRSWTFPSYRHSGIGFRPARTLVFE